MLADGVLPSQLHDKIQRLGKESVTICGDKKLPGRLGGQPPQQKRSEACVPCPPFSEPTSDLLRACAVTDEANSQFRRRHDAHGIPPRDSLAPSRVLHDSSTCAAEWPYP